MSVRRLRGAILRLVRRRGTAVAVGVVLVSPAAWGQIGPGYSTPWMDGLSLVLGATGVALVWSGVTGARPDWVE
jgi:hypothetical protein